MKNKKRLLALAMSAMLAVSTLSSAVYAEGAVSAAASESQGEYEVTNVAFHYEKTELAAGNVSNAYVTYDAKQKDGDGEWMYGLKETNVEIYKQTSATCTTPATVILRALLIDSNSQYHVSDTIEVASALGHSYKETERKTIETPTHFDTGLVQIFKKCDRCGKEISEYLEVPAQEHTWGEAQYDKDSFVNIVLKDGVPELADPTMDGRYDVVVKCTEDAAEKSRETVEVLAKKGVYAVIEEQSGIADELEGMEFSYPSTQLPLDNDSIELANCTKAGWYIVAYYTKDGKRVSDEKIIVTPHHMPLSPVVEFLNDSDARQCEVTYKNDGTYTIKNNSCYLPVTYNEVIYCSADGCPLKNHVISKTAKVAEPNGAHVLDQDLREEIQNSNKKVTYEDLQSMIKKHTCGAYAVLSKDTSTCTEGAAITVDYLCMVCKQVIKTEEVKVTAKGHIEQAPVRENYVAPTCTEMGSYDAVTRCARCNEELRDARHVLIPRVKHTNEISVAENGIGVDDVENELDAKIVKLVFTGDRVVDPYDRYYLNAGRNEEYFNRVGYYKTNEFGVTVKAVTECDHCGYEVVLDSDVVIKIADIKAQEVSGKAGSITLKATYTKDKKTVTAEYTVPYYNTIESYAGRLEEEPKNGLLKEGEEFKYYVDGEFQNEYTGIVSYQGGEFFVGNGVVCSEANGLNLYNDNWYFLSNGQIQKDFTGLALYDGSWFYIRNGKLNDQVTGLVPYQGGTFLFSEGRLRNDVNGLWQNFDGKWYFLALGQVQTSYSGVAEYDGAFFVVKNGMLDTSYNGKIEYQGAEFSVAEGRLIIG